MTKLSRKHPWNGFRGSIGKVIVFKRYGKRTIVGKFPDDSKNDSKPTKEQEKRRIRFKRAVAYAKYVLTDPKLKAKYARKKGHRNAYQAALADYMKKEDALID